MDTMPKLFVCHKCTRAWGSVFRLRKHLPKCQGAAIHTLDKHGSITVRWIKVTTTKFRNPQPYKVPVCLECRGVIVTMQDKHPCYVYGGERKISASLKTKAAAVQRLELLNDSDEESDFE